MVKKSVKKSEKKIEKEVKNEFILNVPNSLTLLRLVLMFVIAYMIFLNYSYVLIAALFAFAAFTDWLDGFFARKLNQKSELGARLDQVIDRVFMIPLVLILLFKVYSVNPTMAFFLIACLSREIIGTPGFVIRIIRDVDAYKVKYIGKVTTFMQSFAVIFIILSMAYPGNFWLNALTAILAIITGLVGIIAGFDYLKDSLR
ncbi:MAG: CDP-alcohol phosphatidyltransferase family protein [Candidatus Pacearchaeota archaeon]|jgi:CDP-diacylglycerol--glycerol-3-phosphate 3-phosphatidyltransferase